MAEKIGVTCDYCGEIHLVEKGGWSICPKIVDDGVAVTEGSWIFIDKQGKVTQTSDIKIMQPYAEAWVKVKQEELAIAV